jgi:O-antigen ligase
MYQRLLSAGLGALGFFLLFSTAGTAVTLVFLLLLALAAPVRFWRAVSWNEPVIVASLLLIAYIALRTFLGEGFTRASLKSVNHYHELLLLPFLYGMMRMSRRPQWFVNGLLLAVVTLALLSWLRPVFTDAAEFMDRRRISAGFGIAICSYLVFEHTRLGRLPRKLGYGLTAFLVTSLIFTNFGRTAQLVLLFLLACAVWRAGRGRMRVPLTAGALLLALAVAGLSHQVRERFVETRSALQAAEHGQVERNSTGARIEMLHNSLTVAREHWLLGTGWQHYPAELSKVSMRRHAEPNKIAGALSENPHDEYLLQLGAGGVPALLLFLLWLACPAWTGWRQSGERRPWGIMLACIAIGFALAALFNSLLLDWVEAHFYVALLAWLLVRRVQEQEPKRP